MFLRRSERFDPDSISAGREVYSAEGEKLGTVSEISGSYLRVDAPWKRDYWLSADYIDRTNGGVYMNFPKSQLDHYKLAQPGLEPDEDPMREISRDAAIISEEEQLEQRARMELELAQQRRQLPPDHEEGTVGIPVEEELSVIESEIGLPMSDIQASQTASPTGAIVNTPLPHWEDPWSSDEEKTTGRARQLWLAGLVLAVLAGLILVAVARRVRR